MTLAPPRPSPRRRPGSPRRVRRALGGLAALACLSHGGDGWADIYKTVGKDGVVSFSNTPSPGGGSSRVVRERPKLPAVMPSDASPERFTRYDAWIRQAATLYQIPEELVRAVIKVESDYDPRAVSTANARGLMQLIPETAARMMVTDVFDPRQNIFGGVRYLRVLANLFNGDLELTVAAYNAGEGAVMRNGGIPPYPETVNYVMRVVTWYRFYRAVSQQAATR
ncbi:MAG: lytic transglycosylase domain-containing protein [Sorangiineae bacterium]|nr:lytic transglycosylase domain-containing protein [Polyangiaceae bacterium]MEB2320930.1 lytic transglycosylase domain-containing protein [Sorangiineae bacterium]